jgi:hypothetical protein
MAWIKKSQSSLYRRHTGQELCLTVNLQGLPKHKSTSLRQAITIIKSNCLFRLSFHVVGKGVCLVMLWPNPARRDKPWNYIPLEFQRYTKLILSTENLYGHVENAWGIPFPKKKKVKRMFSGWDIPRISFLTRNDYRFTTSSLTTSWLQLTANLMMIDYTQWLQSRLTYKSDFELLTANDYKLTSLLQMTTNIDLS